jgi:hypothetical protein
MKSIYSMYRRKPESGVVAIGGIRGGGSIGGVENHRKWLINAKIMALSSANGVWRLAISAGIGVMARKLPKILMA